jgi:hypothetical protein
MLLLMFLFGNNDSSPQCTYSLLVTVIDIVLDDYGRFRNTTCPPRSTALSLFRGSHPTHPLHPPLSCDWHCRVLLLTRQQHCFFFRQVAYPSLQAFKQKVVSLQPQRLFNRLPNDLSLSLLMLGSGWGRWKTIERLCPSSSTWVNVKHEPPPGMTEQPASAIADTNSVQLISPGVLGSATNMRLSKMKLSEDTGIEACELGRDATGSGFNVLSSVKEVDGAVGLVFTFSFVWLSCAATGTAVSPQIV